MIYNKKYLYKTVFILFTLIFTSCVKIGDDEYIEDSRDWIEANSLFNDGKVEQAWIIYDSLKERYKNSSKLYYKLGLISSRSGWEDLAIKYLNRSLEIDSNNWLANKEFSIMYKSKYDYKNGLIEINKVKNNPNIDSESYFLLGFLNIKNKTSENPEIYFKKSLEADPSFTMSSLHYASYLISNKNYEKANRIIENGLKYSPNHTSLIELYCSIEMQQKKYGEAIKKYTKYTEINPKWAYGFLQIGVAYEKIGDNSLAESFYQKSIDVDKNLRFGWQSLATVKERLGKKKEAVDIWESLAVSYDEPYYDFKAADLLKTESNEAEVFIKKLKSSKNPRAKEYLQILGK
ncbi:hypothetical protein JXR93_07795 [bacterium]|nr:hypothetical protein [bacterium]